MYGRQCEIPCSMGCEGNICDIDGQCTCKVYFTGSSCDSCVSRNFGTFCDYKCPKHCLSCVVTNSPLIVSEVLCNACVEGYAGFNCTHAYSCPSNCTTCNSLACTECKVGYHGKKCSFRCLSCAEDRCLKETGECIKDTSFLRIGMCKDTCSYCTESGVCTACKPGFYGTNCTQKCSIGCTSDVCDVTGNCQCSKYFTGSKCDKCVTGKYGAHCNVTCPTNCIYCAYNICTVCADGYYGSTCNISCPDNCHVDGCFRLNGLCKSCSDGRVGAECDQCASGSYMDKADKCVLCSTNCRSLKCNASTGACIDGCVGEHYGTLCDNVCSNGCQTVKSGAKCSATDGVCFSGCRVSYYGHQCNLGCDFHCVNSTCDSTSGICNHGCEKGYAQIGPKCVSGKHAYVCYFSFL